MLEAPIFQSEIREFTVTEISTKIKNLVEGEFGYVRIRGEISGLKIASSGHAYLNLKDKDAILAATCWRPVISRLTFPLKEGLEIVAYGKLTTYAGQSKYQISIDNIEIAGNGALMQMLMERKLKLEKEGLFAQDKKKKLPFLPRRIGIVTSMTGAVIKDMLHRIEDRCPVHVIVWPCAVQGEKAAAEISEGIYCFNNMPNDMKPDLIIVARGGGSIEDLWSFNEEIVVRAIADSLIPIISAIGHETDFTLSDFAADVRAPTPTAAAEFAVPVLADLKHTLMQYSMRLQDILWQMISHKAKILSLCGNILSNPMKLVRYKEQNLDHIIFKLHETLPDMLDKKNMRLTNTISQLKSPKHLVEIKSIALRHLDSSLNMLCESRILEKENIISLQSQLLESLDYRKVLKRGFAIIKLGDEIVSSAKKLQNNQEITLKMHDGTKNAVIR
ncbi:MAG UNVERIFIED_CONTAM: exodeoxyribonuclease VII large subunit [Rickettsiaceae bacterium]|jgi:exodeoxyribonuclease VII large subunit